MGQWKAIITCNDTRMQYPKSLAACVNSHCHWSCIGYCSLQARLTTTLYLNAARDLYTTVLGVKIA